MGAYREREGAVALPPASILCDGERHELIESELTVGRAEENGLVISHAKVSRKHLRVYVDDGRWWVEDLASSHGTSVNGIVLDGSPQVLSDGDGIALGDAVLRFLSGESTRLGAVPTGAVEAQALTIVTGQTVAVGRDAHNDLVLDDPTVSRFHAELAAGESGVELRDLGSSNGTRVNGELVTRAQVDPGGAIGIGRFRITLDGSELRADDERGAIRLEADSVTVAAGDKQILHETTASIEPGELVAIIGESGAGKSTLLKLMAGVNRPSKGRVTINGDPIETRLTDVGYVPQDDIVHPLLSVREALRYAAELRLPADSTAEDVRTAIDGSLGELALDGHAETMIGSLSGGQRKRTGVASEVLGRPGLLFLDEPTTGMDPGLETRMMELFRALADRDRGVALVTHATKNLALCDRVFVLARGGHLVFNGPPQEALTFFGVEDYDGIYTALDSEPVEAWTSRHSQPPTSGPETPAVATSATPPRSVIRQTGILTGRSLKLLLRDRRNLVLLLGQAPLLALAGVALFGANVMQMPGGNPPQAIQMLFLAAITVIWLGSIDAAREIVKEQAVFERESAIGTRLSAYLASKLIVLCGLVSVQTLLYAGILFAFRPLHEPASSWLAMLAILLMTGYAAVAMGLLISAAVSSEAQAMSVIPLAVIPQLLFAGTIVPLAQMPEPAHTIANAIFAQWSLAGIGDAVDMNARIAADPAFSAANPYGTSFFDLALGPALLIQLGFAVLFLVGVIALLRRKTRR